MTLFWHVHANAAADSVANQARAASHAAERRTTSSVHAMQDEVDRLSMVCEGLWHLLRDRLNLTDDELMGYVAELDLSDGVADGKVARTPVKCPDCGRTISTRHQHCLYCGHLLPPKPFGR